MNVLIRFLLLLTCSCVYNVGFSQKEAVSLAEIRFRKGGAAAKLADNCY